jgi:hypothetical protein
MQHSFWAAMCFRWLWYWASDNLSEETDNSVPKDQVWHDCRSQDRNKIHHFGAPMSSVYCNAVLHMSVNSSPLDCFDRVTFLLPTTHSRTGGQNSIPRYFYSWTTSFSSSDNPDGTWCSGHYKKTVLQLTRGSGICWTQSFCGLNCFLANTTGK